MKKEETKALFFREENGRLTKVMGSLRNSNFLRRMTDGTEINFVEIINSVGSPSHRKIAPGFV